MSSRHTAFMTRHADGTVTVEHADPVIWVSREMLDTAEPWVFPTGSRERIQLDTAGEYQYQFIGWRPWPAPVEQAIYERVES